MEQRHLSTAIVAILLLFTARPVQAVEAPLTFTSGTRQVSLIELFTSQGCSSCPPAERWLSRLKHRPGLWQSFVPVAFHVDYWDYLGWRDTLADAAYSLRQRRYRSEGGIRTVYTPGFVVNGSEWRGWFERTALPESRRPAGNLTVRVSNKQLTAQYTPVGDSNSATQLNVALLGADFSQQVEAGENRGRKLTQDFSVLHFMRLEANGNRWQAALPQISGNYGRLALAAWVSRAGTQRPLQATGGWLGTLAGD